MLAREAGTRVLEVSTRRGSGRSPASRVIKNAMIQNLEHIDRLIEADQQDKMLVLECEVHDECLHCGYEPGIMPVQYHCTCPCH